MTTALLQPQKLPPANDGHVRDNLTADERLMRKAVQRVLRAQVAEVHGRLVGGIVSKGGLGSGNFGHEGRPGEVGGSGPGGNTVDREKFFNWVSENYELSETEKVEALEKIPSYIEKVRTAVFDLNEIVDARAERLADEPRRNNDRWRGENIDESNYKELHDQWEKEYFNAWSKENDQIKEIESRFDKEKDEYFWVKDSNSTVRSESIYVSGEAPVVGDIGLSDFRISRHGGEGDRGERGRYGSVSSLPEPFNFVKETKSLKSRSPASAVPFSTKPWDDMVMREVRPIWFGLFKKGGDKALQNIRKFPKHARKMAVLSWAEMQASERVEVKSLKSTPSIVIPEWIEDPDVLTALEREMFKFAHGINQTTADDLRDELMAGMENGETIPQLADRISGLSDEWVEGWRSEMIARTETARAFSTGHIEAWRSTGVVDRKVWVAAGDACPFCQQMDGTVVELDENFFDQGDEQATNWRGQEVVMGHDYSDVNGPPLHPSCRCVLAGMLTGEEESE